MEIERKFLIDKLPEHLSDYPCDHIVQAYISADPVIRIRRKNGGCILTVKSSGLLAREETEMPIPPESFYHLMAKTDGIAIEKTRYKIPAEGGFLIELDIFEGAYQGFVMAEVEFPDVESALAYQPPAWFGTEVTSNPDYHNSNLSRRTAPQIEEFLKNLRG